MKPRHKKLAIIASGVTALGIASILVLNAFQSNLVFFFSPPKWQITKRRLARAFGLAVWWKKAASGAKADGVTVNFLVTDTAKVIPVVYKGILPDLFKEGKGVVAQGKLASDGVFRADEVLAKHDENYMPPEAATAIDQADKARKTVLVQ